MERLDMSNSNPVKVPMIPGSKLGKDEQGEKVDGTNYKQLVGSLIYMTATRPDMMYVASLVLSAGI